MKRYILMMILLCAAMILSACGADNREDAALSDGSLTQQAEGSTQAEAVMEEVPLLTNDEVAAMVGAKTGSEKTAGNESEARAAAEAASSAGGTVDLDLTKISGTVVYSQVYDMMVEPESYMGQRIRIRGNFSYFQDPDTKQEYFAAVIADATACCAQGIEFVWRGEHTYPQDYPPLDTEITVTGTFSTYFEGDYMYVQLADAEVEWNK